jgi:hypothetical protein
MNTAVQLRPLAGAGAPRCDLVLGLPREALLGSLGPIALFAAGELVAYRLRHCRKTRLSVFRTLDLDDPLAVAIPGVRPRVQLLLELHSAGRVRLARGLFDRLAKEGVEAARLPDAFYLRIGVALGGRLPARTLLHSLLHRSHPASIQCVLPRPTDG